MKKCFKMLLAICALLLSLSTIAHASSAANPKTPEMPADTSSPEFQKIKSLEGRWMTKTSMFGKKDEKVYTEYEVTSNGSAVLEKIFPGTKNEMISVYYDDNGKLAMTHYCIMRNRPTMKLVDSTEDSITLGKAKIAGLKSKNQPSMGEISLHFKDKNHFSSTCGSGSKGKDKHPPMTMEFTRVR